MEGAGRLGLSVAASTNAQRLGGVAVELKSHLPIERQARVIGATRLDQQLIGGGKDRATWALAAMLASLAAARRLEEQGWPSGAGSG